MPGNPNADPNRPPQENPVRDPGPQDKDGHEQKPSQDLPPSDEGKRSDARPD